MTARSHEQVTSAVIDHMVYTQARQAPVKRCHAERRSGTKTSTKLESVPLTQRLDQALWKLKYARFMFPPERMWTVRILFPAGNRRRTRSGMTFQ